MIPSLLWTGKSLYDLADARVAACAAGNETPLLRELFDSSVEDARLIEVFESLRVPRQLFKFLYRVLMAHSQANVDTDPKWQIDSYTFESQLDLFERDQYTGN